MAITHITNLVTKALILIGALNWGLVGAFGVDLVKFLFRYPTLTRVVYIVIGIASIVQLLKCICTSDNIN